MFADDRILEFPYLGNQEISWKATTNRKEILKRVAGQNEYSISSFPVCKKVTNKAYDGQKQNL